MVQRLKASARSEPPRRYPLGQGGKGKHNAHDNSDFLSHSLSFSSVVNSFLHSFTGYVDDPEKEDADKPMVTPREKVCPLSDESTY